MSGIFSKPQASQTENKYGIKVMFLHGLEGRGPNGTKAKFLQEEWAATCPTLRTQRLSELRQQCSGQWNLISKEAISEALEVPYQDAKDAVRYGKPDLIVGSSMGGAILFKLIAEGFHKGMSVFCAPAIENLLPSKLVSKVEKDSAYSLSSSVWLLGETDTVVSNRHCASLARSLGGNVIFSPGDGHRLNKAVESNILNSCLLTSMEMSEL